MNSKTAVQNQFGETIKQARTEAQLGLREAALMLQINPGYLSNLENNATKAMPSDEVIKKLSKLLKLDYENLRDMATQIAPDHRGMKKLSEEEVRGMQAFYRFAKEHNMTPTEAMKKVEKVLAEGKTKRG
jgi:transcriptional regulator with XRE-family HTH domain